MKSVVRTSKPPEKRTWVEKVTDDDNHWLMARSLEKDGLHKEAAYHYLKDASRQRDLNILRAALSSFRAGMCLSSAGENQRAVRLLLAARDLYRKAASVSAGGPDAAWLRERISCCRRGASELKALGENERSAGGSS
ncbi:MAG: hypothetical protein ACE5QF_09575 [Thermoplasmata archaeon]